MKHFMTCCKCSTKVPYGTVFYEFVKNWRRVHKSKRCDCAKCFDELLEELQMDSFVLCAKCEEKISKLIQDFCN